MTGRGARFADLMPRFLSAVVMLAVGAAAVWFGAPVFDLLVAALSGAMVWELSRMLDPAAPGGKTEATGVTAAVAVYVFANSLSGLWSLAALAAAVVLLTWRMPTRRGIYAGYLGMILFAAFGLILLRSGYGIPWVLWLVCLVVGSDVAGYFAGRVIGGPKLWPRVSPKKTWSGTIAGWLMALPIGWIFMGSLGMGPGLLLVSVLIATAGQVGDVAESAIKRVAGVKDSSNLIPGHGGVMDRFDAMVAAAFVFLILDALGVLVLISGAV
ncbi:phosphatidate cytidylyltransferase [Roseicitreum antarcticum]|uniref:Phosphatidate cytidylyltransferase n=1 Tax=Roseicitreum antarcticum TaxID=564137 RepID=A0A1H2VU37_9RHOB|nr:phosphatidate cytidylyltransferase [Roseicitreum antarcticum]SDW71873.1 phosphatidate cytidylyltransferase [Roseicitreum antarcticum]